MSDSDFSESDLELDEMEENVFVAGAPPPLPPCPPPPTSPPPPLSEDGGSGGVGFSAQATNLETGASEDLNENKVPAFGSMGRTTRAQSSGTKARQMHKQNYKYKVERQESGGFSGGGATRRKSDEQVAATAGKSRAISAFNNNPSLGENHFSSGPSLTVTPEGSVEPVSLIELQKQHLRGIFAAACTDTTNGEMVLGKQNLKEAVSMTGLAPSRALLAQFLPGNKKTVDLSKFLGVVLENLDYEHDVEGDLTMLFEMFDEDSTGTMTTKTLRHLMMDVLTSDKTQLSRAEFDEFLEYAGLSGDEVIDYTKLANNFMLSKPELKMVIENP